MTTASIKAALRLACLVPIAICLIVSLTRAFYFDPSTLALGLALLILLGVIARAFGPLPDSFAKALKTLDDVVIRPERHFVPRVLLLHLICVPVVLVACGGAVERSIDCSEAAAVVEFRSWRGERTRTVASTSAMLRTWLWPRQSLNARFVTAASRRLKAIDDGTTISCEVPPPPPPPPPPRTPFRVALSSSYAQALRGLVEQVARRHPELELSIAVVPYADARATFCSTGAHSDLILIDEVWLSPSCTLKPVDGLVPSNLPIHGALQRRGWIGSSRVAVPFFANIMGRYSRVADGTVPRSRRLGFRRDSSNNIVEVLFELLAERGCDPSAMVSGGALLLPREETLRSFSLMQRHAKRRPARSSAAELFELLAAGGVTDVLGWAAWPSASFSPTMGPTRFQVSGFPLFGGWFWAIPESSTQSRLAGLLIGELTAREIQASLPRGLISVLTNVETGDPAIRSALARSVSRPRMAGWQTVEVELGDSLQAALDSGGPLNLTGEHVRFGPQRCSLHPAVAASREAARQPRRQSTNARRHDG
jgi:hypothetical protein